MRVGLVCNLRMSKLGSCALNFWLRWGLSKCFHSFCWGISILMLLLISMSILSGPNRVLGLRVLAFLLLNRLLLLVLWHKRGILSFVFF